MDETNKQLRRSKTFMMEEVISSMGTCIKIALSRAPEPEVDYHELGFDVFIELIKFAFNNPQLVERHTLESYLVNLNELLRNEEVLTEESELEDLFWEKIVKIIEDDPSYGPELIYKFDLWDTICMRATSKLRLNNRLAYFFSYVILHAACN